MKQYVIVHAVPAMKVSLNCRFLYNLYYSFLKLSVSKYRSWVFFNGAESSESKAFRSDKINYVLYCENIGHGFKVFMSLLTFLKVQYYRGWTHKTTNVI